MNSLVMRFFHVLSSVITQNNCIIAVFPGCVINWTIFEYRVLNYDALYNKMIIIIQDNNFNPIILNYF